MPLYRNRVAALLAMFAMALSALWPLISQAKPRVPGTQVPVCTIEGITHYVELPAPDTPVEQRSSSHHEHCKMCVFGAAKLALAAVTHLLPTSRAREPAAQTSCAVFSASASDLPAQPRAPPIPS